MPVAQITIADFTTEALAGTGVFDHMMRSIQNQVGQEFNQNRIRGTDYATVYLGALNAVGDRALEFLLRKDEQYLKNQILEIELANKAKEGQLIDAQIAKINAEILLVGAEQAKAEAQTALLTQQLANAVIEGRVLEAQECKLKGEFDLIVAQIAKTQAETALLTQKTVTETAQTNGTGVSPDSMMGAQITLYGRQAEGFLRDAEQKAAKILADTWITRRTTDEATQANVTNKLQDSDVGRAIEKLLLGVGA